MLKTVVCLRPQNLSKLKKPLQVFSFSIQNSANAEEVDIHIDGEIVDASTQAVIEAFFGDTTSVSYKSFRNEINRSKAKVFNIFVNSPGGHVGDALAIYDFLTELQNTGKVVNTVGRGIVASSATLILMAGKSPKMSANSWFMMHTVSGGTYGTVDQIENYAATMRKFNDKIIDLYSSKSGTPRETVSALMLAESWLTADEAKDKGFISEVEGSMAFTNKLNPEYWNYNNTAVLNSYNSSVKPEANQNLEMKKLFSDLKTEIINAITGVKPANGENNTELLNSIANAIGKPFENLGAQIETQVSDIITEANKPLVDRVEKLETANAQLKTKNEELEAEIVNKLGKQTTEQMANTAAPVGSYN